MVQAFEHMVAHYGYGVIAMLIGLQCAGLLIPGETVMLASAAFAATTGQLNIFWVIAAGIAGAIIGNVAGFVVGRTLGVAFLSRYGARFGLTARRLVLGRYLFRRHGGKMVFFCRFLTVLRSFAPVMAGANAMKWRGFLGWTVAGGIAWPTLHCLVAFLLGDTARRLPPPLQIGFLIVVVVCVMLGLRFVHRNEVRLEEAAMRSEAHENS